MLFNSIAFLLFFPIVCVLYFCIPAKKIRVRNTLLLAASYYFYMNWEPAYALLLLTSTVVTYITALGISRFEEKRKKKLFLVSSLVLNLAILFLFKYYNFLSSNIETVLQASGIGIDIPEFGLLLPVGISFYTFQALGYSIDVYRGTTKVEHDFATYALFVSFFPQLVAGPIERSYNLLPQFKKEHKAELEPLKIEHANEVQMNDDQKCYLIQISTQNLAGFKKVHSLLTKKLEEHLSNTVMIIPARKRVNGKEYRTFVSKKVPRDRTLTAVFDAYLDDILYPATIIGKRIRYPVGKTTRTYKVIVDPLDKEAINYRLDAIKACFKALTNRKLDIEF